MRLIFCVIVPISLSLAMSAGASTNVSPTARITRSSSKKAASKARGHGVGD
jgi:hypothetical protein